MHNSMFSVSMLSKSDAPSFFDAGDCHSFSSTDTRSMSSPRSSQLPKGKSLARRPFLSWYSTACCLFGGLIDSLCGLAVLHIVALECAWQPCGHYHPTAPIIYYLGKTSTLRTDDSGSDGLQKYPYSL